MRSSRIYLMELPILVKGILTALVERQVAKVAAETPNSSAACRVVSNSGNDMNCLRWIDLETSSPFN